jgi:hypothetical protein
VDSTSINLNEIWIRKDDAFIVMTLLKSWQMLAVSGGCDWPHSGVAVIG